LKTILNKGFKMKEKKFDYNDYVYLRIPKSKWEEWQKRENEGKRVRVDFKSLKSFRIEYKWKNEKKSKSAIRASRTKEARANLKMFNVLNDFYNTLFKNESDLTIYKLAKKAGVSYMTAKRFWQEFNLDTWINEFKSNNNNLNKFLYTNLAEDLVILNIKNEKQLDKLK
jgi:hypothetical protein